MLFNSIDFAIFLPIVFFLYWFVINKNLKAQNILLIVASYIFYGWWDWRFLSLLICSSFVDYIVGIGLSKTDKKQTRKLLLLTSIFVNLGLLGFFKYYNFFLETFVEAFSFFGHSINPHGLNIVLPIGISFYTFQTLSYSIDVYKRKFEPTKDIFAFFAFVSFFPQLVAGPIERAKNLLPQFYKKRVFEYDKAIDGMRQILWGLFKKIVIADNCAIYVNDIFENYFSCSGSTLLLGAILFSFQIYGDFSGYSDIAIGASRLFGFRLKRNFAYPFFSRDMSEFWRKWHISLFSWFRDFIFVPLGGRFSKPWIRVRNIFIVFILSGLWHGAAWTFIIWGILNAICIVPDILRNKRRQGTKIVAEGRLLPKPKELFQMLTTFLIFSFTLVIFRSESIYDSIQYIRRIFSISLFSLPEVFPKNVIVLIALFILAEWLQRDKQHALQFDDVALPIIVRWGLYYGIIWTVFYFGGHQQKFIYFQF